MLKYTGVPIRTVEYLKNRDIALPGAFLSTKEIPVCYQYCQTKQPNVKTNNDIIGTATNFRVDGDIMVCDVTINPLIPMAHHFENIIDNYTVHIGQNKSELVMTVTRLIIYNKSFKSERDNDIINQAKNDLNMSNCEESDGK